MSKDKNQGSGAVSSNATVVRQGQDGKSGEVWRRVGDGVLEDGPYLCYHPDWGREIVWVWQGNFGTIGAGEDEPTHWTPLPSEPPDV